LNCTLQDFTFRIAFANRHHQDHVHRYIPEPRTCFVLVVVANCGLAMLRKDRPHRCFHLCHREDVKTLRFFSCFLSLLPPRTTSESKHPQFQFCIAAKIVVASCFPFLAEAFPQSPPPNYSSHPLDLCIVPSQITTDTPRYIASYLSPRSIPSFSFPPPALLHARTQGSIC
jgi:hypothetical protein